MYQMLVYENYSKFISATDTIRKMKHNVNEMKAEMDSLVRNMEGISTRMHTVNAFLGGKRAKVRVPIMLALLQGHIMSHFKLAFTNNATQQEDGAHSVLPIAPCDTAPCGWVCVIRWTSWWRCAVCSSASSSSSTCPSTSPDTCRCVTAHARVNYGRAASRKEKLLGRAPVV